MLIDPRRSFLNYPGGFPGFNEGHPAARGIGQGVGFVGIAYQDNFLNVLDGGVGTVVGSSTPQLTDFGRAMTFAANALLSFPGFRAANDAANTIAAIYKPVSSSNTFLFQNSSTGSGVSFKMDTVGVNGLQFDPWGGSPALSTLVPVNGHTQFMAMSTDYSTAAYFIIADFNTGSVQIVSTTPPAVPTPPNGTYVVGNANTINVGAGGSLHALMFSPTFMSIAEMVQWAYDPWSLWYPSASRNFSVGVFVPPPVLTFGLAAAEW
jgi:hypothetical protein